MNKQYFSDEKRKCSACNNDLEKVMFMVITWGKKRSHTTTFCNRCYKARRPVRETTEHNMVLLPDIMPDDVIPIFFKVPTMCNVKGLDVYKAADIQIGREEVIDKTNHCHNKDFMKDPDYVEFDKKRMLKEKDTPLKEDEGLNLLDEISKSKPILTNKEKKMLEEKS